MAGPGTASGRKMVRTYLDEIETGTPEMQEAEERKSKKERRQLPPGAESKTLYKDIIRIAWPSLIELTLTSLVSMVDMMMVGNIPGSGVQAMSAVSLATQPRFLFLMLIMSLNTGVTAVIARARGAGRHDEANDILRQALMMTFIIAIPATIVGYFTSEPLIRFMAAGGIADETIMLSTKYLQIQMLGFVTMAIPSTITASLRGTGNSRIPMVYNMTANVVNVFLNWVLIYGKLGFPAMGVEGASLATVIGQGVSCVMAFYAVGTGKNYLKLSFARFKVNFTILKQIFKVGLPALGEQGIMRVGMIVFTRVVTSLGEVNLTTHQVCMSIQSLSFMTGQAFAVSSTTLVGQSLGKLRSDMAEHYSRRCRRLGLYVAIGLMLIFAVFGGQVVKLYNGSIYVDGGIDMSKVQVIVLGSLIMLFVAMLQPIQSSQFILAGGLRGAGDTRSTAMISLVTMLVVRPIIGFALVDWLGWGGINFALPEWAVNTVAFLTGVPKDITGSVQVNLGLIGAWIAVAADQCLRSMLVLMRYNSGKWKKIKL